MVSDLTVICVHRLPGVGGPRTCIKSKDIEESRVFVSKVAKPKSRKGLDAPATFAVQIKPSTHFSYFKIRYSGCHCQRRDNFILRIYKFQMGRSGHHDPQPAAGGPGMGLHVANETGPGMECEEGTYRTPTALPRPSGRRCRGSAAARPAHSPLAALKPTVTSTCRSGPPAGLTGSDSASGGAAAVTVSPRPRAAIGKPEDRFNLTA